MGKRACCSRPVALEATIPPDDLDLEATIAAQAAVISALQAQVASLEDANAALAARVVELERRLGRDSSNSSNRTLSGRDAWSPRSA
jgi:uncharacterized coiled-coil protein SlyX